MQHFLSKFYPTKITCYMAGIPSLQIKIILHHLAERKAVFVCYASVINVTPNAPPTEAKFSSKSPPPRVSLVGIW